MKKHSHNPFTSALPLCTMILYLANCADTNSTASADKISIASSSSATTQQGVQLSSSAKENPVITEIYLTANGNTWSVTLSKNSSADSLARLLENGPITINAHDYGNFEKVGSLGTSLPQKDTSITTKPGDLILYQGNQITLYYDENTWTFTHLGYIQGATKENLLKVLGDGDVSMTFSIDK